MYRIVFLLLGNFWWQGCEPGIPVAVQQLPFYNEPTFTPAFFTEPLMAKDSIDHRIGNFSFINQDSVSINQDCIDGKIHVANFIFTSCGSICPVMTRHMKIVSDSFLNEPGLVLLSYSVTPWIDKPYVLRAYRERNGIKNSSWHFLTGDKSEIYSLARKSYFAEEDIGFSKDSTEFLHTEHILLIDKTRRIRGIYNGTLLLEIQQLVADIKTLKAE